jgi:hypothetical protein
MKDGNVRPNGLTHYHRPVSIAFGDRAPAVNYSTSAIIGQVIRPR